MYINLLTQLVNIQRVHKEYLKFPYSTMDEHVLEILERHGFVKKFERKGRGAKKYFEITLRYDNDEGVINGVQFLSKPSRRLFIGYRDLKPVRQGHGTAILSTPQGIMTSSDARKNKVGGQLLFNIW